MTIMALTRGICSNDYFAVSSLICMVMAIYTGHKMISGKSRKKKEVSVESVED